MPIRDTCAVLREDFLPEMLNRQSAVKKVESVKLALQFAVITFAIVMYRVHTLARYIRRQYLNVTTYLICNQS